MIICSHFQYNTKKVSCKDKTNIFYIMEKYLSNLIKKKAGNIRVPLDRTRKIWYNERWTVPRETKKAR